MAGEHAWQGIGVCMAMGIFVAGRGVCDKCQLAKGWYASYWNADLVIYLLLIVIAVVLWSYCFGYWVRYVTRGRVHPITWTDCRLGYFLYIFGRQYSSMLLVLMSLEKCFAVYFPLKSITVCTGKTVKWATGILGVILSGYDVMCFFFRKSEVDKTSGYKICVTDPNFRNIYFVYFRVDAFLYSFVPFALMFITNVAIVFKFMKAKYQSLSSTSTESTNQALVKSANRGTAMVVTVSVTFLLLTAPISVYSASSRWVPLLKHPLFRAFMSLAQYLNHSINGILYCIVGSQFRREMFILICRSECTMLTT